MIYLGQPYSSPDLELVKTRVIFAEGVCAALNANGIHVYSPIVHWHSICRRFDMPSDAAHWEKTDFHFIEASSAFYILAIPGWVRSIGLEAEVRHAVKLLKPIYSVAVLEMNYDTERRMHLLPLINVAPIHDVAQLLRYFRANDNKELGTDTINGADSR